MSLSNTQRTLKYLKEKDYKCDIVERWIPNPKHPRNILANPVSKLWLKTGAKLILIGWRKVKKHPRKGKLKVWRPRVKVYTLEDFGLEDKSAK